MSHYLLRPYQDKQNRGVSTIVVLSHLHAIALRISNEMTSTRRARIPEDLLVRVICASVFRRIQPTGTTRYAIQYDTVLHQLAAIVPSAVNFFLASVPLNGAFIVKGDLIRVELLPTDALELETYVNSQQFSRDLSTIKAYAQAQSLLFVPLNWAVAQIVPSLTLRVVGNRDSMVSIPIEGRVMTRTVSQAEFDALPENTVHCERDTPFLAQSIIAYTIRNLSKKVEWRRDAGGQPIAGQSVEVLVNQDRTFNSIGVGPEFLSIHTSGNSSAIDTPSKQQALAIPLCEVVTNSMLPDGTDIPFGTGTFVQLEGPLEYYGLVNEAITGIFLKWYAAPVIEALNKAGGVDSRSEAKNTTPAQGTPNAQQPRPAGPGDDQLSGRPGVQATTGAQAVNGQQQPVNGGPPPASGNGQGKGGKGKNNKGAGVIPVRQGTTFTPLDTSDDAFRGRKPKRRNK